MRARLVSTVLLLAACGPNNAGDDSGTAGSSSTTGTTGPGSTTGTTGTTGEPTSSSGVVEATEVGISSTGDGGSCPDVNSHYQDGECFCDVPYDWCEPEDANDLTCCLPGSLTDGATTSADDTTEGPQDCAVPPPARCDGDAGAFYCDQDAACGPAGSSFYQCVDGLYVAAPDALGDSCAADGFDFAYGCVTADDGVEIVCGDGPGTPCDDGDIDVCADTTTIHFCLHGKLGALDCAKHCQDVGDEMGITYDAGLCAMTRTETSCMCCDAGEPGCPI